MNRNEDDDVSLDLDAENEAVSDEPAAPLQPEEPDPAAQAFGRLEGQIALVRRAVEHLAAERAEIVVPDYGSTLVEMNASLEAVGRGLSRIEQMPAMTVTPETLGSRIEAAARSARKEDEDVIRHWKSAAHGQQQTIAQALGSAVRRSEQLRRERMAFAAGAAIAVLLMLFLPGTIARELPASWQVPEWMARRVLGEGSVLEGGIRMVRSANPKAWEDLSQAAQIANANRDQIEHCARSARASKRPVNCLVQVK